MIDESVYTETDPGLLRVIRADLRAMARLKEQALTTKTALDILLLPGTAAVLVFRVAQWAHHHHLRPLSRLLYCANVALFGADLAPGAVIGPGMSIGHPVGMKIANGVTIGPRVVLTSDVGIGPGLARDGQPGRVVVGSDVVFFHRASVLAPITIGDGAVIGAGSVVVHDVAAEDVVAGTPARRVKDRAAMPFADADAQWRHTWNLAPSTNGFVPPARAATP
jgi:serine O-acetyltransferase